LRAGKRERFPFRSDLSEEVKAGAVRADTGKMATSAGTKRASDRLVSQTAVAADGNVLIEQTRRNVARRLVDRDLYASLLLGVAFLVTALVLASTFDSTRSFEPLTVALLVAAYAIATRVDFEIGTGYACPTQLVLVPMLVLLPVTFVPLFVLAGLLLGGVPEYARGRVPVGRSLLRLVNSWHAVGPTLILLGAGEPYPTPRHLPIYAAALLAQFVFDFASTAVRDRVGLGVSPLSLLPVMAWIWVVDSALTPIGILAALGSIAHPELVLFSLPLMGLLAHFAHDRKSHIDKALELSNAYRGTAFLLGDVVEADDAYTGLHSQDVVSLVLAVADELELHPDERRSAEFTAILHDVGKIKIPKEIINKPGPLTDEERAIINTHTIEGQRMLEKVGGLLGEVGYLVRSCHERWDGAGYPDGLAGEQIPLVSRIVCACDAFSAMTTNRSYRQAMSRPEAIEELRRCAGTQFDPQVAEALILAADVSRPAQVLSAA
jgi:HD-GYP domain-containing protein (c-di-GMP phosphodiesterase class II)